MRRVDSIGLALAITAAILLASACAPAQPPATDRSVPPSLEIVSLPSPAARGSGEPDVAVAADGRFLMSWIETDRKESTVKFASLSLAGRFSAARTIVKGAPLLVNWADFPSIVALPGGALAAHWLAPLRDAPHAYSVRVAFSDGEEAPWTGGIEPHTDGTATEHGFVSLLPWDNGRLGVVWLDGREMAATAAHSASTRGIPGPGAMTLRTATLSPAGPIRDEAILDERVCDCCQTAMARSDRAVLVAYRDRTEDEVRDISLVRFRDGRWSAPEPLSHDGWKVPGCPVNGPALDARGLQVAAAWFTAADDQPRVKVALSQDGGDHFAPPVVVDDGDPLGRVDVLVLPDASVVVSWIEQTGDGAEVRLKRIGSDGSPGPSTTVAATGASRASGFPRMAKSGADILIAWTDTSDTSQVQAALAQSRKASP